MKQQVISRYRPMYKDLMVQQWHVEVKSLKINGSLCWNTKCMKIDVVSVVSLVFEKAHQVRPIMTADFN